MPDWLLAGLNLPGLGWLMLLTFLAGLLYGFAGFGAALIFMPLATIFVTPIMAVSGFALASLGSVFTVLPQGWRAADKRATLTMLAAAIATLPLGVLILRSTDPTILRWAVSLVVLTTLAALVTGWRHTRKPGPAGWIAVGGGVGFLGGSVGLNGPVVVLFQLGGQDEVARSRGNTICVLTLSSMAYLPMIALQGAVPTGAIGLGVMLAPFYAAGSLLGRGLFDPARAVLYRRVAYGIIGTAGLMGLPIFS